MVRHDLFEQVERGEAGRQLQGCFVRESPRDAIRQQQNDESARLSGVCCSCPAETGLLDLVTNDLIGPPEIVLGQEAVREKASLGRDAAEQARLMTLQPDSDRGLSLRIRGTFQKGLVGGLHLWGEVVGFAPGIGGEAIDCVADFVRHSGWPLGRTDRGRSGGPDAGTPPPRRGRVPPSLPKTQAPVDDGHRQPIRDRCSDGAASPAVIGQGTPGARAKPCRHAAPGHILERVSCVVTVRIANRGVPPMVTLWPLRGANPHDRRNDSVSRFPYRDDDRARQRPEDRVIERLPRREPRPDLGWVFSDAGVAFESLVPLS